METEWIDRMHLNVYQPGQQIAFAGVVFCHRHRAVAFATTLVMKNNPHVSVDRIERLSERHAIRRATSAKDVRKAKGLQEHGVAYDARKSVIEPWTDNIDRLVRERLTGPSPRFTAAHGWVEVRYVSLIHPRACSLDQAASRLTFFQRVFRDNRDLKCPIETLPILHRPVSRNIKSRLLAGAIREPRMPCLGCDDKSFIMKQHPVTYQRHQLAQRVVDGTAPPSISLTRRGAGIATGPLSPSRLWHMIRSFDALWQRVGPTFPLSAGALHQGISNTSVPP